MSLRQLATRSGIEEWAQPFRLVTALQEGTGHIVRLGCAVPFAPERRIPSALEALFAYVTVENGSYVSRRIGI